MATKKRKRKRRKFAKLVIAVIIIILFSNFIRNKMNKDEKFSDNEIMQYTSIAKSFANTKHLGTTNNVIIFGQDQKIILNALSNESITVDYSEKDYKISATSATMQLIENSVIIVTNLLSQNKSSIDEIYKIEISYSKKLISICPKKDSYNVYIMDFSNKNSKWYTKKNKKDIF